MNSTSLANMFFRRSSRIVAICLLLTIGILPTIKGRNADREIFSLLNLDYPGLEQVKKLHLENNDKAALDALVDYYRNRTDIHNANLDFEALTISDREQQWADEALEHTFYVHDGYQPAFNYGTDIDWAYWPVKDNELRWQLHRHKWFTPMGKAYYLNKDEKYAKEWKFQYLDWIAKNPRLQIDKQEYELTSKEEMKATIENVRFAWRPLETSHRLQDQINQFGLFIGSKHFTGDFIAQFLVNYHQHAVHILNNYSAQGNHLLFEAQRMLYAGAYFPEFKDAKAWRKSGIDILNKEIKVQVYPDGGHFELDLHYHLASINIFCKALRMADVNNFRDEFPQYYINTIEDMIVFYMNVCYPDYSNPCFSDAKKGDPKEELQNYKDWLLLFPQNRQIEYFATQGEQGLAPTNLSKGHLASGFFTFRNGWKQDATVMVVKAGPEGEWHCQPDNGTFELWFNGRNLFPDSGSYVYAGDKKVMELRNWFRQTAVHNTLTLDNKNLETTESVTKLWQPEGDVQILVTENPSYKDLTHRRSIFFVNNEYFVIVDEAIGAAKGKLNLNFQLTDGDVKIDAKNLGLTTLFEGNSQVRMQSFAPQNTVLKEEEGWYSEAYLKRTKRTAISLNTDKTTGETMRYITVIYPTSNSKDEPKISARFKTKSNETNKMSLEVSVGNKKRIIEYQL